MATSKKKIKPTKEEKELEKKNAGKILHKFITETIERLVKPPVVYSREYKILKKLLEIYPQQIFSNIDIKVPSLAFYIKEEGKNHLDKIKNKIEFILPRETEKVVLSENKIGKDKKVERPLTIKDFLNKYK